MASNDRRRLRLLIARERTSCRIATTLCIGMLLPLACVSTSWWILRRIHLGELGTHLLAGGGILLMLGFLTMQGRPVELLTRRKSWIAATRLVGAGTAGFVLLTLTAGIHRGTLVTSFGAGTLGAALAEEVVFRRMAPRWIGTRLRRSGANANVAWYVSAVVAQVSFATAHIITREAATLAQTVGESARLFVLGILFYDLAATSGLWAAVSVHAALNVAIASSIDALNDSMTALTATACGAIAFGALYAQRTWSLIPPVRTSVRRRKACP